VTSEGGGSVTEAGDRPEGGRRTGTGETPAPAPGTTGPARSRRIAVLVAAAAAALEVAALGVWIGDAVGTSLALITGLAASAAVTAFGAWRLHLGDERGTAVLLAAALLTLPAVVATGSDLASAHASSLLWFVSAAALLVAAALAWTARDRDRWWGGGLASPLLVAGGLFVIAGTLLPTTWYRPEAGAGAERWWRLALWEQGLSVSTVSLLLTPAVVLVVLWAASAFARPLAAGMLAALAVTGVASAAGNIWFVLGEPELWVTPVGWIDLVGHLLLLVLAALWWTAPDPTPPVLETTAPGQAP
jgi:hypothetical protein